ncbi:MAG: haloacid dehalogenase-like hydrolase [Candidatus Wallbacteria bacterium]|nr:haloacid dehalogenase-like hydrolase [Candidatus Wallbacteria bacterium]
MLSRSTPAALLAALWLTTVPATALEGFSPAVSRRLDALLAGPPGTAVFDADHTLWVDDVGEGFFEWLVRTGRLPRVGGTENPFEEYVRIEKSDKLRAYGMAVTRMAGLAESDVTRWAASYFRVVFARRVYAAQRNLIRALQGKGWDVWIVSASNRWIVQAGAPYLGVAPSRVVGIDLVVRDGVLTSELAYPVTWGLGKVAAIERFIGARPDFASGDSRGDLEMMEQARRLALLVVYPKKSSQAGMRATARRRGWLTQRLP